MVTRLVFLVLAALLALPLAPTASPVEAKKRPRTVTRTFDNAAVIALPNASASPAAAALHPSAIAVRGLRGTIRDVNVRLNDLTHTFPSDVQVLLVGPDGQTAIVMAVVGGAADVSGVSLRLDDEATAALPETTLQTGTFRPTNVSGNAIALKPPAPAPSQDGNAALSVFDRTGPNGTWHLFVQDDAAVTDPGQFAGGWDLKITVKGKKEKKRR